jgi:hypothetical protein
MEVFQQQFLAFMLFIWQLINSRMQALFDESFEATVCLFLSPRHPEVTILSTKQRRGCVARVFRHPFRHLSTPTEEYWRRGQIEYGSVRVTPTFGGGNAIRTAPLWTEPCHTLQWKRGIQWWPPCCTAAQNGQTAWERLGFEVLGSSPWLPLICDSFFVPLVCRSVTRNKVVDEILHTPWCNVSKKLILLGHKHQK